MTRIPSLGLCALASFSLVFVASAAWADPQHQHPHPPATSDVYPKGELPDAYAVSAKGVAYFNTPNRHAAPIHVREPTVVGKVTLNLTARADVLVQFTSGLAAETGEGCPCSVRASLKVDGQPLMIVKRVNVGTPAAQTIDKYEHDRQSADGSYVFDLPAGKHDIALVIHQIDGVSSQLEAYYVNLQAIPFYK